MRLWLELGPGKSCPSPTASLVALAERIVSVLSSVTLTFCPRATPPSRSASPATARNEPFIYFVLSRPPGGYTPAAESSIAEPQRNGQEKFGSAARLWAGLSSFCIVCTRRARAFRRG